MEIYHQITPLEEPKLCAPHLAATIKFNWGGVEENVETFERNVQDLINHIRGNLDAEWKMKSLSSMTSELVSERVAAVLQLMDIFEEKQRREAPIISPTKQAAQFAVTTKDVYIGRHVGRVIGKGGASINHIKAVSGVRNIDTKAKQGYAVICGTEQQVATAEELIRAKCR